MTEVVKENDFVELEYTGYVVDGGEKTAFDTTSAEAARQNDLFKEQTKYEPVVVCIGKGHLLKGLDSQLVGKSVGEHHAVKVLPEEGFGRKNAKLIQLVSTSKFRQQNITPFPGMQVNIDGLLGVVRTVTGGRTVVDFNHPLAGRELEYEVKVRRVVTDANEKVSAVLKLIGVDPAKLKPAASEGSVSMESDSEIPDEARQRIESSIKAAIPEIKNVVFSVKPASREVADKSSATKSGHA